MRIVAFFLNINVTVKAAPTSAGGQLFILFPNWFITQRASIEFCLTRVWIV